MENTKKLIEKIDKISKPTLMKEIASVVAECQEADLELISMAKYSEHNYTRNVIYKNKDFEMIVITWKLGQASLVHNHKNSACIVKVLAGKATEIVFDYAQNGLLYPSQVNCMDKNSVTWSYDQDVHQIINVNSEDLITLHIYSPALTDMEAFPLEQTTFNNYGQLYEHMSNIGNVTTFKSLTTY